MCSGLKDKSIFRYHDIVVDFSTVVSSSITTGEEPGVISGNSMEEGNACENNFSPAIKPFNFSQQKGKLLQNDYFTESGPPIIFSPNYQKNVYLITWVVSVLM